MKRMLMTAMFESVSHCPTLFRNKCLKDLSHLDEAAVRAGAELPIVRMAPRPRASVGVARERVLVAARNVDHAAADATENGDGNDQRTVRRKEKMK
jgi:hypothetical protein